MIVFSVHVVIFFEQLCLKKWWTFPYPCSWTNEPFKDDPFHDHFSYYHPCVCVCVSKYNIFVFCFFFSNFVQQLHVSLFFFMYDLHSDLIFFFYKIGVVKKTTKTLVEYSCYLYVAVFLLCTSSLEWIIFWPTVSFVTSEVGTWCKARCWIPCHWR